MSFILNKPEGLVDTVFVRGEISDTADALRGEIAAAQVQSDWTEADDSKMSFILNKPEGLVDTIFVRGEISDTADALREEMAAELDNYYTKMGVDTLLAAKADTTDIPEVNDANLLVICPKNRVENLDVAPDTVKFSANAAEDVDVTLPVVNPLTLRFTVGDSVIIEYNASEPALEEQFINDGIIEIPTGGITTDAIVTYFSNEEVDGDDVQRIMEALRGNNPLNDALRDTAVNYIKSHRNYAMEIAQYYLKTATADEVQTLYNTLHTYAPDAENQAIAIAKQIIKTHQSDAVEILDYYIRHADPEDVLSLLNTLELTVRGELYADVRAHIRDYVEQYFKDNLDVVTRLAKYYLEHATAADVDNLFNSLDNAPTDTKNRIKHYINTYLDNYLQSNCYQQIPGCTPVTPGGH